MPTDPSSIPQHVVESAILAASRGIKGCEYAPGQFCGGTHTDCYYAAIVTAALDALMLDETVQVADAYFDDQPVEVRPSDVLAAVLARASVTEERERQDRDGITCLTCGITRPAATVDLDTRCPNCAATSQKETTSWRASRPATATASRQAGSRTVSGSAPTRTWCSNAPATSTT